MAVSTSFAISGANGLYTDALREVLTDRLPGAQEYPLDSLRDRIGFMYQVPTGLKIDPRSYSVQSWIKSALSEEKEIVTDKSRLYLEMERYGAADRMAPTVPLTSMKTVPPNSIWIVKPTGKYTGGGRDQRIVRTTAELRQAQADYARRRLGGIVSRYIVNPVLHNGKKMHLRMYFLVRAPGMAPDGTPLPYFYEMWNRGKINTAALPYVPDQFNDPRIHDTHMKSTAADYDFPEDFQVAPDAVYVGMQAALHVVGEILRPHAKPYAESKFGFEVFGVDFLVDADTHQPVLLEVNSRVAYGPVGGVKDAILAETQRAYTPEHGPWPARYQQWSRDYFNWIFDRGIAPFYGARDQPSLDTARGLCYTPYRSFIISGSTGLLHAHLRELLLAQGLTEGGATVGYVHLEKLCHDLTRFDRVAVATPCYLKSILSDRKRAITDKDKLHENLRGSPFVAKTWPVDAVPREIKNTVLIIRPIGEGASCGKGIYLSTTPKEFGQARASIRRESKTLRLKSIIASEYVTNPMVRDGRKFHLRMFFLVRAGPDTNEEDPAWDLWPRGRIVTAAEPYVAGNWHRREIHDTHSETTDHNLWFPEDLPEIPGWTVRALANHLYRQMQEVLGQAYMAVKDVVPYPESTNAYEVFGCDFLVTDTAQIVLLEINDRVGYRDLGEPPVYTANAFSEPWYVDGTYTFADFSRDYFDWANAMVISRVMQPTRPLAPLQNFGIDGLGRLYLQSTSIGYATQADADYMQAIVNQFYNQPHTVASIRAIAPRCIVEELVAGFDSGWEWVVSTILRVLEEEAARYVDGPLTVDAIVSAFEVLFGTKKVGSKWDDWEIVPAYIRPTVQVTTMESIVGVDPLGATVHVLFGRWKPEYVDALVTFRHNVWMASGIKLSSRAATRAFWASVEDTYSLHVILGLEGTLVAATRLAVYAGWGEIPGAWWFGDLAASVPGPVLTITRLVVDPSVQRRGVGQYLDGIGIGLAVALGCRSVFTDVPPYRVEALRAMGFESLTGGKVSENFPGLVWTPMVYRI